MNIHNRTSTVWTRYVRRDSANRETGGISEGSRAVLGAARLAARYSAGPNTASILVFSVAALKGFTM